MKKKMPLFWENQISSSFKYNLDANIYLVISAVGTPNNDTLNSSVTGEVLQGFAGDDTYMVNHRSVTIKEVLGGGIDTVISTFDIRLGTYLENAYLMGTTARRVYGNNHDNLIDTKGQDFVDANGISKGVNNIISSAGGNDVIYTGFGNDWINGGSGNDLIYSGADNDTVWGSFGNDLIYGGQGNDRLSGDIGDDQIDGEDGEDRIWGGSGNDTLSGGLGNDRIVGGHGADLIYGNEGNDGLSGEGGDDTFHAGAGDDRVIAGSGNDFVYGEEGADTINGNDGVDTIDGGIGNDIIRGDTGNDFLYGDAGVDIIDGGEGDDYISGGIDSDTLFGGLGSDTFVFKSTDISTSDRIMDFVSGTDKIDVSDIAAQTGYGIEAFSISTSTNGFLLKFTNVATGQVFNIVEISGTDSNTFNMNDVVFGM